MVLLEHRHVRAECLLEGTTNAIVGLPAGEQTQSFEDPSRIGIDDEDGAVEGIQQDIVRGLGADPFDRQEASAQLGRFQRIQPPMAAGLQIRLAKAPDPL